MKRRYIKETKNGTPMSGADVHIGLYYCIRCNKSYFLHTLPDLMVFQCTLRERIYFQSFIAVTVIAAIPFHNICYTGAAFSLVL